MQEKTMYYQTLNISTRRNYELQKKLMDAIQEAFMKKGDIVKKISCTKKYQSWETKDVNFFSVRNIHPQTSQVKMYNNKFIKYKISITNNLNKVSSFSLILPLTFQGTFTIDDDFVSTILWTPIDWEVVFSFDESYAIRDLIDEKINFFWNIHLISWMSYIENFWYELPWGKSKTFSGKVLMHQYSKTNMFEQVWKPNVAKEIGLKSQHLLAIQKEDGDVELHSLEKGNGNSCMLSKNMSRDNYLTAFSHSDFILKDKLGDLKFIQWRYLFDLPNVENMDDIKFQSNLDFVCLTIKDKIYHSCLNKKTLDIVKDIYSPKGEALKVKKEEILSLLKKIRSTGDHWLFALRLNDVKDYHTSFYEEIMNILYQIPSFDKLVKHFHLLKMVNSSPYREQGFLMLKATSRWLELIDGLWFNFEYQKKYYLRLIQIQWNLFELELVKVNKEWEIQVIEIVEKINIDGANNREIDFFTTNPILKKNKLFNLHLLKSYLLSWDKIIINLAPKTPQIIKWRSANIIEHDQGLKRSFERNGRIYSRDYKYLLSPNKDPNKILREVATQNKLPDNVCSVYVMSETRIFNENIFEAPTFYCDEAKKHFLNNLSYNAIEKIESGVSIYSAWDWKLPYMLSTVYWGSADISFGSKFEQRFGKGTNTVFIHREMLHNGKGKALLTYNNLVA